MESANVASYQTFANQWHVDILLTSNNDPFPSQLKFVLVNTSFIYETNITFNQNLTISLLIPDKNIQLW